MPEDWEVKVSGGVPILGIRLGDQDILHCLEAQLETREGIEGVWWEQGWVHPMDKTEDVAKHIFRQHNKMADSWAEADGRTESWHKESGV